MNKEVKELEAKVKALFPENIEGIYISKNDYDRLYGDLTLENIELKQEIERLNNKILLIKGIIRTPRALDSSLACAIIENVLGSDKECILKK